MAANSLQQFNLGSSEPEYCALNKCDNVALDYPCADCSTAPDPDFSGDRLEDVRYCGDTHRKHDLEAHRKTCRDRRWLRDGSRIGEMHYELFIAARKEMYEWVVVKQDGDDVVRKYIVKDCDKPASEQSFCGSEIDPESKLCALSVNGCVYALQLGSPFLAYMTTGSDFRLNEIHVKPKPSAIIEVRAENGDRIALEEYFHSEVCLSPSFHPTQSGLFEEDGITLDASAAQLGWFDEQIVRTEFVASAKTTPHPENRKLAFGFFLRRHQQRLIEEDWEDSERNHHIRKEATFRVVNNLLFLELEKRGGAKSILALEYEEWESFKKEVTEKARKELKKLREKLDDIDFVVVAGEEEKRAEKEKLVEELDGHGYQEMIRVFEEVSS